MLCQNCGKREATTHIKRVVNGETSESHFCAECASSLGYKDVFNGWGFNFSELLGGFLGENMTNNSLLSGGTRCQKCGNAWSDIVREGKLGCSECYRTFFEKLQPSLQRIHGRTRHTGKVSGSAGQHAPVQQKTEQELKEEQIEQLKKRMADAVAEQDFEQAAKLRDEIRALEA